jgi:hypothetical protein
MTVEGFRWCIIAYEHGNDVPLDMRFRSEAEARLKADAMIPTRGYSSVAVYELRSRLVCEWRDG